MGSIFAPSLLKRRVYVGTALQNKYDLAGLLEVEHLAWGLPGENIEASREKLAARVASYCEGVTIARHEGRAAGSQYAFRFTWDGDTEILRSWDEATAAGWTDRIHLPQGNTGFLVGVGVVPQFRKQLFSHELRWQGSRRISQLLIAFTLDKLFDDGVSQVIACARMPLYHTKPQMSVWDYCEYRPEDGKLYDPVLRFHKGMGAEILKPVEYALDDPESRNAGCWVIYRRRFEV